MNDSSEQLDLIEVEPVAVKTPTGGATPGAPVNPCVRAFGLGPEGKRCKECALLIRRDDCAKVYLKCALRANTRGPATDHRAGWPACGKFAEKGKGQFSDTKL
jgi:hypothetical protein